MLDVYVWGDLFPVFAIEDCSFGLQLLIFTLPPAFRTAGPRGVGDDLHSAPAKGSHCQLPPRHPP